MGFDKLIIYGYSCKIKKLCYNCIDKFIDK